MKLASKIALCFFVIVASASSLTAKEWRGIVPLHSTREDVTRLLGPSPDANNIRAKYRLETEDVYIVFVSREGYFDDCVKQLPIDTVLMIQITPKTELRLTDLQIDEKKFEKFDPSEPPDIGYQGYIDDEAGLIIRTFEGKIDEITYIAAKKDKHLCSGYYENPKQFIQVMVCGLRLGSLKFDEYGRLSRFDEKARLDNFAVELQHQPSTSGYIIAYAGKRARVNEAKSWAERAKKYLAERGVESERITIIDGGYREELTVELYLQPVGTLAPIVVPTVEPSEVEIISDRAKQGKKRKRGKS